MAVVPYVPIQPLRRAAGGTAIADSRARAPFFNRAEFSIEVREPRSLLKSTPARELTNPLAAPLLDIDQELWQFVQLTPSFVARVFIAALLLAYGMIHDNPLFIVGGLIFLPFMPLLLAFAFGALAREWELVGQSIIAAVTATLLIAAGAAAVAALADPPMMFDMFAPILAGALFSLVIAIAAALATADDGRDAGLCGIEARRSANFATRELICGYPAPRHPPPNRPSFSPARRCI